MSIKGKKIIALVFAVMLVGAMLAGCGEPAEEDFDDFGVEENGMEDDFDDGMEDDFDDDFDDGFEDDMDGMDGGF